MQFSERCLSWLSFETLKLLERDLCRLASRARKNGYRKQAEAARVKIDRVRFELRLGVRRDEWIRERVEKTRKWRAKRDRETFEKARKRWRTRRLAA